LCELNRDKINESTKRIDVNRKLLNFTIIK
jgi:hypothetical protein